jgi:hypothetical protein
MSLLFIFIAGTLFSLNLSAEISKVTVKWGTGVCADSCIRDMQKQFSAINGVAELIINEQEAQIDLRWKPKTPFSFRPINSALRLIGPRIKDIRVSVRGVIRHDSQNVILESLGDNTEFILLGNITPSATDYVIQYNIENHALPQTVRQKFLESESNYEVVVIEGPLFEAIRSPPFYLIVEEAHSINLKSP